MLDYLPTEEIPIETKWILTKNQVIWFLVVLVPAFIFGMSFALSSFVY